MLQLRNLVQNETSLFKSTTTTSKTFSSPTASKHFLMIKVRSNSKKKMKIKSLEETEIEEEKSSDFIETNCGEKQVRHICSVTTMYKQL